MNERRTRRCPGLVAMLASALLFAACDGSKEREQAPAPAAPAPIPAPKPPPQPAFTEPEALQVLLALDSSRIASGYTVRGLSESESILEYGRVMVVDHAAASRLIDSVAAATGRTPAESPTSQQVRLATQQFVTELMARDTGVNNAYLAREVRDHEQTLMLLDTALIPSAQDSALRTVFEQLRPMLEAHLQQARRIVAARAAAAAQRAAQAQVSVPTTTTND